MPVNNNYSGTIYDIGEVIPSYVDSVYTPHVWYDQSKSYESMNNVFEILQVSEGLLLGESEDDMWTIEEILDEILRYLNLHIVQDGYDYYIFDWETAKTDTQVVWLDIFTGETMTKQYQTITVPLNAYAGDDTQLSIADVYNQVSVTDAIEEFDSVLFSPFDDDQLQNLTSPQQYMLEYAATGIGKDAFRVFYDMTRNDALPETNYGAGSDAYKRQWLMKLKKSAYWDFLKNGQSVYNSLDVDGNGKYYNQWKLPKYIDETPFASGLVSFAHGDEYNKENTQNIENIAKFEDYLCINVAGNGVDEKSASLVQDEDYPFLPNPPAMFPNENDLRDCGLDIKYIYTSDGNYSPADPSIKNYLVFNGKILMTVARQATGSYGFWRLLPGYYTADAYNYVTMRANNPNKGGNYVDWVVWMRKNNKFNQYSGWPSDKDDAGQIYGGRTCASSKNDDGAYYGLLFYDNAYPTSAESANKAMTNMMPPMDNGELNKRFKYSIDKYSYLYSSGNDFDIISYVDILACQLSIGDMFCEEYVTREVKNGVTYAYKRFNWVSAQDLMARGEGNGYDLLPDGTIRYKAYVNLAVNINNGQFLIGDELPMYNNIDTTMGLEQTGMAIPLPSDKNLSGELRFSIIGPVNISWDNGIRRHPTWFRHTQVTPNVVSVMPHVDKIWIKSFNVELVSDRGKNVEYDDADIVYRSDEQKKYINKKDDIEFKFTTALTADEAANMQVNFTTNRSDIMDSTGLAILSITDNHTNETDKPEKIYVDAYYREYCNPKTIIETTVHDNVSHPFNKYNFGFMQGKTYYFVSEEKDVRRATTKLTLKER